MSLYSKTFFLIALVSTQVTKSSIVLKQNKFTMGAHAIAKGERPYLDTKKAASITSSGPTRTSGKKSTVNFKAHPQVKIYVDKGKGN